MLMTLKYQKRLNAENKFMILVQKIKIKIPYAFIIIINLYIS